MSIARLATPVALLFMAATIDAATARPREVPPATPDGKPVSCVPIVGLQSKVRDDRTIDFFQGRRAWRNTLPQSCPSLGFEQAFSYATSLSQLCSSDIITVFRQGGGIPGASCGLGEFQPVKGVKP